MVGLIDNFIHCLRRFRTACTGLKRRQISLTCRHLLRHLSLFGVLTSPSNHEEIRMRRFSVNEVHIKKAEFKTYRHNGT